MDSHYPCSGFGGQVILTRRPVAATPPRHARDADCARTRSTAARWPTVEVDDRLRRLRRNHGTQIGLPDAL